MLHGGGVFPLIKGDTHMDKVATLVEENIALAKYIAGKYENTGVEYDDLFGLAQFGLFKAAKTWDESKSKFSTYSAKCMNNEILMYLRKVKDKYTDSLDDVAFSGDPLSSTTGYDITPSNTNVEGEVLFQSYMDKVDYFIKSLPDREAYIFINYYGINGLEMSQREIAEYLGISQSYISRLVKEMTKQLKQEVLFVDEAV